MTEKKKVAKKPKPKAEKKSRKGVGGRPTKYSKDMAKLVCERVASSTLGLGRLCAMHDDLPDKTTINLWRSVHPEFSIQYAEAKMKQADLLAEECLEIADDGTNDFMESLGEDAAAIPYKIMGEVVNRSRLRIDTRKWLAAKLLPKQYGEQRKIETLEGENDALRSELRELREKLDKKHEKDY